MNSEEQQTIINELEQELIDAYDFINRFCDEIENNELLSKEQITQLLKLAEEEFEEEVTDTKVKSLELLKEVQQKLDNNEYHKLLEKLKESG